MVDKPRVYVDADVFLSVLKGEPAHAKALPVLLAAERRDVQLVASRLLSVEVGCWGGGRGDQRSSDDFLMRWLEGVHPEWVEVDILTVREARKLSWAHNLRAADAIHLATAVRRHCGHFMAFDKGYPHNQVVEGVEVGEPRVVWPPTLFEGDMAG